VLAHASYLGCIVPYLIAAHPVELLIARSQKTSTLHHSQFPRGMSFTLFETATTKLLSMPDGCNVQGKWMARP